MKIVLLLGCLLAARLHAGEALRAEQRFGLGRTQVELKSGADVLGLWQASRSMGAMRLPAGWVLKGRLAGDDHSSRWLAEGPGGRSAELFFTASAPGADNGLPANDDTFVINVLPGAEVQRSWSLTFEAPADGTWLLPFNQGLQVPQADVTGLDPGYDLDLRSGHFLSLPAWGWQRGGQGLRFQAWSPDGALSLGLKRRQVGWVLRPARGQWQQQPLWIAGTDGSAPDWARGVERATREWLRLGPGLGASANKALAGAVNIHYWKKIAWWSNEPKPQTLAQEMKALGLDRVLWSQKAEADAERGLGAQGWLAGSYENFQDLYPADTPLDWVNKDGWPEQAVRLQDGDWKRGWPHKQDGKTYYAGVRSSRAAVAYVRAAVDERVARGQQALFFDTTTASAPVEDWDPKHPMTRGQDLAYKREQLAYAFGRGLVVGSESGHNGVLGAVHYFEGMQSPWPGRFEDAGYVLGEIRPPTEAMQRWTLSPRFRAPLFDLAYHPHYVGYEYWGDAANRLPQYWRRRDLFSVLYAQPQLWVMDEARWKEQKDAAIKSYRTWSPIVRHLFGQKMTDWRWVDKVGDVQETAWEDGSVIRVDFAKDTFKLSGPVAVAVQALKPPF